MRKTKFSGANTALQRRTEFFPRLPPGALQTTRSRQSFQQVTGSIRTMFGTLTQTWCLLSGLDFAPKTQNSQGKSPQWLNTETHNIKTPEQSLFACWVKNSRPSAVQGEELSVPSQDTPGAWTLFRAEFTSTISTLPLQAGIGSSGRTGGAF